MATKKARPNDEEKKQGRAGDGGRGGRPVRVLVIRHGVAADVSEFAKTGSPDADRPLTKSGRKRMRRGAKGLVALLPELGSIATSPLTRAAETAEIVAAAYAKAGEKLDVTRLSALAPGKSVNLLLGWLGDRPRGEVAAVVGHEPHLGLFVSWALTGLRESFVELKKGAAVLIEFPDEVRAGHARLVWSLRSKHLRAIGAE
ncbi:MAG TPA: histidine phosphatase family protein [Humisphaera sp.]